MPTDSTKRHAIDRHGMRTLAQQLRNAAGVRDYVTLRFLGMQIIDATGILPNRSSDGIQSPARQLESATGAASLLEHYSGLTGPRSWLSMVPRTSLATLLSDFLPQLSVDEPSVRTEAARAGPSVLGNGSSAVSTSVTQGDWLPARSTPPPVFESLRRETSCVFAPTSRIWSTPLLGEPQTAEVLDHLATMLTGFTRASRRDRLDGLMAVFPSRHGETISSLAALTETVLRGLARRDGLPLPFGNPGRPGWQFIFHGERYYVLAFGSVYPSNHSRYAYNSPHALLFFQPDISFKRVASSDGRVSRATRLRIRQRYMDVGMAYDISHIETPVVARSFVLPLGANEPSVEWWAAQPLRPNPTQAGLL